VVVAGEAVAASVAVVAAAIHAAVRPPAAVFPNVPVRPPRTRVGVVAALVAADARRPASFPLGVGAAWAVVLAVPVGRPPGNCPPT